MINPQRWPALVLLGLVASGAPVGGQALNEAFLRSAVLVTFEVAPGKGSVGTGFFLFRPVNGDQGHVLLVTNKHVLPPPGAPRNIQIRVTAGTGANATVRSIEIPLVGKDGKYLDTVRLHPNPGFDVAAVNVTETILKQGIQATWLPLDLLSTPERLKNENITVGDEIFLLGYPNAIFDPRNVSPILRSGVIATVPSEGYAFNDALRKQFGLPDRIDGFLVDANVFPGSSGSVVILKQQPTTIGADGGTVVSAAKKIPYVLGIVSGSIPINDTALGTTQRMGLARSRVFCGSHSRGCPAISKVSCGLTRHAADSARDCDALRLMPDVSWLIQVDYRFTHWRSHG